MTWLDPARPRPTPRPEPSQAKSSQVKSSQVCHLQVTRGPPWDAPGPCLAHTPRRGAHPAPPENGTPQGTHARPRPAVSRWSVSVRRARAAAGAHTCAARVKSGQARSGQAETGQKIKSNGPLWRSKTPSRRARPRRVTSGGGRYGTRYCEPRQTGATWWDATPRIADDGCFSCFLVTM